MGVSRSTGKGICESTYADVSTESTDIRISTCTEISNRRTLVCGSTFTYGKYDMHQPRLACIYLSSENVVTHGVEKVKEVVRYADIL